MITLHVASQQKNSAARETIWSLSPVMCLNGWLAQEDILIKARYKSYCSFFCHLLLWCTFYSVQYLSKSKPWRWRHWFSGPSSPTCALAPAAWPTYFLIFPASLKRVLLADCLFYLFIYLCKMDGRQASCTASHWNRYMIPSQLVNNINH